MFDILIIGSAAIWYLFDASIQLITYIDILRMNSLDEQRSYDKSGVVYSCLKKDNLALI